MRISVASRLLQTGIIAFTGLMLVVATAAAGEVKVMSSGGFAAAYRALAPEFERESKNTLTIAWGPSMGDTKDTIPSRLQRGEPADVLIMVGDALGKLIKDGKVVADSRVDIARSPIGMVVRAGAPKPDISTVEALKRTLLEAKSIAYSDSASGVYIANELFAKLGIKDQVAGKSRMIPADPVAGVVARGDAEIGFQQISELLPIPGVDLVGPLPDEVQKITIYAVGIPVGAPNPEGGKALIKFLNSPAAAPAIKKTGLDPTSTVASK